VTRIGFGMASVAEVVVALSTVRSSLRGNSLCGRDVAGLLDDVERAVDADIRPVDDIRSTARYRRHVARVLVRGFVEEVARRRDSR